MQFVDLAAQQKLIKDDLESKIAAVLKHGRYVMGPEVAELEGELATYVNVKHCIGVASGTDALLVAMMAAGVGRGDEVITSSFSFFATVETIVLLGATPVFVDIDPSTYNVEANDIGRAITKNTKAIIPVSLYGQCSDMDAISKIAAPKGITVIEDAAQSFGATYKGRKSCSLSDIACTSFFPSKPLGSYGDSGAVFTNDDALAQAMREIRVHGQSHRYNHTRIGVNARMDTIQAAVLLAKMRIFDREVETRAEVGNRYDALLGDHFQTPFVSEFNTSVYAQYTIRVDDRDRIVAALSDLGVPTAVHYPVPLHKQPAIAMSSVSLPHSERAAKEVLSLPSHPYLNAKDQDRIVRSLIDAASSC